MANKKNEEKKTNPFLWILFAVIIPLIIVVVIAIIFLYFSGFSLSEWARESDNAVANLIEDEIIVEQIEDDANSIDNEEQASLESEQDEEIEYLLSVIDELEYTITDLEQEVLRLENNLEQDSTGEDTEETPEGASELKKLAQSFEEMDSERAAQILSTMENNEAVLILRDISTDIRGEILQEMDNEQAAELSLLLMEE